MSAIRIGQGYDIHRLAADYPLMIGGVAIQSPLGSIAHSDGDVLLHALIDALLGALALGDIGDHFPPSDAAYKNADSAELLGKAYQLVTAKGYRVGNVDATVFLEAPKLGPYKQAIRERMADLLGIGVDCVSVKAKTAEKLGAVGHRQAIGASVVVLLAK